MTIRAYIYKYIYRYIYMNVYMGVCMHVYMVPVCIDKLKKYYISAMY